MKTTEIIAQNSTQFLQNQPDKNVWKTVAGLSLCFISSMIFSVMHATGKHLYNTTNITPWEVVYWRSLGLIICNGLTAYFTGNSIIDVPRKFGWVMFWRVITGILGALFIFAQTKVLSFSKANTLFFTYPSFAMFFAYWMLGERITKYDIISSICSFFGVIAIAFDPNASKKINDVEFEPFYAPAVPILAAIFCSMTNDFRDRCR